MNHNLILLTNGCVGIDTEFNISFSSLPIFFKVNFWCVALLVIINIVISVYMCVYMYIKDVVLQLCCFVVLKIIMLYISEKYIGMMLYH